ncbi:MAG: DUF2066 domain-containing protein [Gammaproteobacteria bacterium]|nr:DUF2066 domain-containing protein [Gammaproteobacteria bacterium]
MKANLARALALMISGPGLALVLSLALAGPAAADISGLFEMTVPVADNSSATRSAAARQAMALALIRITGDRGAASAASTARLRSGAERYVQQFVYERVTNDAPEHAFDLRFVFDANALTDGIKQAGYSVWGRQRPGLLVWLYVDAADTTGFIGPAGDVAPEIAADLARQAGLRGLPLKLPLLDLEELRVVTPEAIAASRMDQIMQASAMYDTAGVLAGVLTQQGPNLWSIAWRMNINGARSAWTADVDDPRLALGSGINAAADVLARSYAPRGMLAVADGVEMAISGVNSLDDYARAVTYLDSLDAVTDLQVKRVVPGSIALRVTVTGGGVNLDRLLALGAVVRPLPGEPGRYQLVPGAL